MSVSGLSLLPISAPPPSPFLHPLQPPLESCSIADASPPPGIICLNDRLVGKLDLCPIQYVVPVTNLIKPTPLQTPDPSPPCGAAPHLHICAAPHHTTPIPARPSLHLHPMSRFNKTGGGSSPGAVTRSGEGRRRHHLQGLGIN